MAQPPKKSKVKVLLGVLVGLGALQYYMSSSSRVELFKASNGIEVVKEKGVSIEELEKRALVIENFRNISSIEQLNGPSSTSPQDLADPNFSERLASKTAKPVADLSSGTFPSTTETDSARPVASLEATAPDSSENRDVPEASKNLAVQQDQDKDRKPVTVQQAFGPELPTTCSDDLKQVKIEIRYLQQPGKPPCEVWLLTQHDRSTAWQSERLWTANWDTNFCKDKATELVQQYRSWGFKCR